MDALLSGLWSYLAAAGAFLAVVIASYFRGRGDATARAEAGHANSRLKSINQSKEVEDEVSRLGHADVDRRLGRWMRDEPER